MTRSTSAVAFSRSSDSSRSRRSCANSPSAPAVEELLRRDAGAEPRFGIALRLRALATLLLALERRRIAHPRLRTTPIFKRGITAGIADRRNRFRGSSHGSNPKPVMSALGQKQTLGLFWPKTLDRLDRDRKWSSKCDAPQDRADLNRHPDATTRRSSAARQRLLTAVRFIF